MSPLRFLEDVVKKMNVLDAAVQAIELTSEAAVDAVKMQMYKGIKQDGTNIRPPYAPITVINKNRVGAPSDHVTLRNHGDYYRGIFIDVRGRGFTMQSADWKNDKLDDRYGPNLIGLAKMGRIEYIRTLRPVFKDQVFNGATGRGSRIPTHRKPVYTGGSYGNKLTIPGNAKTEGY